MKAVFWRFHEQNLALINLIPTASTIRTPHSMIRRYTEAIPATRYFHGSGSFAFWFTLASLDASSCKSSTNLIALSVTLNEDRTSNDLSTTELPANKVDSLLAWPSRWKNIFTLNAPWQW